jgi:hypothetical protein
MAYNIETDRRLWMSLSKILECTTRLAPSNLGSFSSCCQTAMGVSQRALSLSAHTAGGPPPPPSPGEGGVTTPYSWSIAGTTVMSLPRGTGGFNHPRESLNPSLHTGGPRRGRSFRRRLRRWCRWHGSQSVEELTSYVIASAYVTARLCRHEGVTATPRGSGYGDTSSFGFS